MEERTRHEVGAFLRQGAWFEGLPAALQDRILRRSAVRKFVKGQMFQVEDSRSAGLIAVLQGRVLMLRHVGEDEPALIHVGGPGFWFGEMGVLLGDRTLVTAVAQTPVRALVLPKPEFDRIVAEEPRHYPAFARIAFERYRLALRFLAEARRLSPDDRLRLRLADLAEIRRLETTVTGPAVDLDLSQSELARIVGLSRQKLNGRLRRIQEEGWVELGPRRIRVLDSDGLRATAVGGLLALSRARAAS